MRPRIVLLLALCACGHSLAAEPVSPPPPIDAFARSPAVDGVSISADGRYLASLSEVNGRHAVTVLDRIKGGPTRMVFTVKDTDAFDVSWCGWANATRLLCGFIAAVTEDVPDAENFNHLSRGKFTYATTRLVGVNADGTDMKVLVQNSYARAAQFQDRILDWTPEEPDTVLIELDDDGDSYPAVFELNVYNGKLKERVGAAPPIRDFLTDGHGQVRFGIGVKDTRISYYARLLGDKEWRLLSTMEAFAKPETLQPIAVLPGKNRVLASGESDGRQALWELDLEDKQPPKLVFQDPQVDVEEPIMAAGGRLIGVFYESDRPHAFYTDPRARSVVEGTNQFLTGSYNTIFDETPDDKVYVIRAHSDVDRGSFHVLDVSSGKGELVYLGTAYPELRDYPLPPMKSIEYTARDGTKIPGYLTVPTGSSEKNLPLIVMPHGGPIARDSWGFDFLRLFLASRGYAVLQMNFRGSGGFGWEWLHAAHQNWGGLTYDDIVDGTRWAIAQGIADPKRVGIVGWSFGGYAALLGATRNGDLFRCAASIAGVSDLQELRRNARYFTDWKIVREQLGTDREKLLADSPVKHADQVSIPVLMVHGVEDWTVPVEHSKRMDAALKRAGKQHELILIPHGDHQLAWRSERVTLLTALEKFLTANMGGTHD